MDKIELKDYIEAFKQAADGANSTLSSERETAIKFYHGEVDESPESGERHTEVSTDVRDVIDGQLADLMEIFLASRRVIEFEPQNLEDVSTAKLLTEAANYVIFKQNRGGLVFYEWMKAALMEKTVALKFWYEKKTRDLVEEYSGKTEQEVMLLKADPEVTIVGIEGPVMDDFLGPLYTVKCQRKTGRIKLKVIRPEHFFIDPNHDSLSFEECQYAEAITPNTPFSDVRELVGNWQLDSEDFNTDSGLTDAPETDARDIYGLRDSNGPDERVTLRDVYVRYDQDEDGVAELLHVVMVDKEVVLVEPIERMPFAAICPVPIPFSYQGLSEADLCIPTQRTKTRIMRAQLDSLMLSVKPRIGIMDNMVNVNDLLTWRAGSPIRTKGQPGQLLSPISIPFVGKEAFPMLEYQDFARENRTGWTRYSQGTGGDSLNKTATGVSLITTAGNKRLRLIARLFAESGFRDLYTGIIWLLAKYQTKPMLMRINGKDITVDPRVWATQYDITVNIGTGVTEQSQRLQSLQLLASMQASMMQVGMSHLVTDQNIYNAGMLVAEASGFNQEGMFFTPPGENNPPPTPQPPPEIVKEQMKLQFEAQDRQAAREHEAYMAMSDHEHKRELAAMQAVSTRNTERMKVSNEAEVERERLEREMEIEREKVALEMEVKKQEAEFRHEERKEQQEFRQRQEVKKVQVERGKDGKLSGTITNGD